MSLPQYPPPPSPTTPLRTAPLPSTTESFPQQYQQSPRPPTSTSFYPFTPVSHAPPEHTQLTVRRESIPLLPQPSGTNSTGNGHLARRMTYQGPTNGTFAPGIAAPAVSHQRYPQPHSASLPPSYPHHAASQIQSGTPPLLPRAHQISHTQSPNNLPQIDPAMAPTPLIKPPPKKRSRRSSTNQSQSGPSVANSAMSQSRPVVSSSDSATSQKLQEPSNAEKLLQVLTREKKQRACTNCRKAKLKCIVAPGETDCVRCRSREEKCVFTPRNDEDWQQNLVPVIHTATEHLAQLSAAVHHLLDHLVQQNIVPPFSSAEYPHGLERYEPPDRDAFGHQRNEVDDHKGRKRRNGKRKSISEDPEDGAERVEELQQTTSPIVELEPLSAATSTGAFPPQSQQQKRFWNGSLPTSTAVAGSSLIRPPPAHTPPTPKLGYSSAAYQQYAQDFSNLTYRQTFDGSASVSLFMGSANDAQNATTQTVYYPFRSSIEQMSPAENAPLPMSIQEFGENDAAFFNPGGHKVSPGSEVALSSPPTQTPSTTHHSSRIGTDHLVSSLTSSIRSQTISPVRDGATLGHTTQHLMSSVLTDPSNVEAFSEVIGSRDPRKDIVKKMIVSGANATTLVTYFHIHMSQFMYGYRLQFNSFPYIGGPEVITPLIMAVLCLIASERFPLLQHYHAPLADEVLNLLKKSPAESWQSFEAPYGTMSDFDGDEPLNAEFGLGPEEIVAACVLATYMTERQEAAIIARSAFRWARGWIQLLSDTPAARALTVAELTGCIPPERQATVKDMARVWLLCYIVDSTERLQLSFPAPPLRDPTPHCDVLVVTDGREPLSIDDVLLTYHGRLMAILNDWRRRFEVMMTASDSPQEHKEPMTCLANQVNQQLEWWKEQFSFRFPALAQEASLSPKSRLLDLTWLFVRMSVNSTVSKCLNTARVYENSGTDLTNGLVPLTNAEKAHGHSTLVVNSAIRLLQICAGWAPKDGLTNLSPTYLFFVTLAGSEILTAIKDSVENGRPCPTSKDQVTPLLRNVGEMLVLGELDQKHVSRTTAKTLFLYVDQLSMMGPAKPSQQQQQQQQALS